MPADIAASLSETVSNLSEPLLMEVQHVNQLLALRGEKFVRQIYRTVLGREPDPEGEAHFTRRAIALHDKVAILCEFASSAEGAARTQTLPGMAKLIREHQPSKGRIRSWLQRAAQAMSATGRIEVSLDEIGMLAEDRLQAVEDRLGALDLLARDQARAMAQQQQAFGEHGRALVEMRLALQEHARASSAQLAALLEEVQRSAAALAAWPQTLDAQLLALFESYAVRASALPDEPPATLRASALSLRLSAAQGPARLIEDLTCGLAQSDEAQRLAGSTPP
jgi:hypothetical protein